MTGKESLVTTYEPVTTPYNTPATITPQPAALEHTALAHLLLTRAQYGGVGVHRDGYVMVDGTLVTLAVQLAVSLLDRSVAVWWYRDDYGHQTALLTERGAQLLTRWDAALFDGGAAL